MNFENYFRKNLKNPIEKSLFMWKLHLITIQPYIRGFLFIVVEEITIND